MPSAREIVAQPRQRPLVQEAGEIVGAVGQQLAAAEPDEEIEVLALDALDSASRGGLAERRMREPSGVASPRKPASRCEQVRVGRAREQRGRAAHIPARARHRLRRVARLALVLTVKIGPQHLAVDCRSLPRPTSTRSAGIRSQLETDGCEMPIRRASSLTPPAA